jgi:hypothetical protein
MSLLRNCPIKLLQIVFIALIFFHHTSSKQLLNAHPVLFPFSLKLRMYVCHRCIYLFIYSYITIIIIVFHALCTLSHFTCNISDAYTCEIQLKHDYIMYVYKCI